jgi:hypothetical protein
MKNQASVNISDDPCDYDDDDDDGAAAAHTLPAKPRLLDTRTKVLVVCTAFMSVSDATMKNGG